MGCCGPRCSTCSAKSITSCTAATWDRRPSSTSCEAIAPVTAVYGNTDGWELRHRLPRVAPRGARRLHDRRDPRRPVRLAHPGEAAGGVSRRGDHRLRPHPPAAAHAGGHGGDRDESGRRGAAAVRPAGLGRHPGARARHSAARPAGAAHARSTRTSLRPFCSPPSSPRSRAPRLRPIRGDSLAIRDVPDRPSARRRGSTPSGGAPPQVDTRDPAGPRAGVAAARRGHRVRGRDDPDRSVSWVDALDVCLDVSRVIAPAARRTTTSMVVHAPRAGQQRGVSRPSRALGAAARRSRLATRGRAREGGGWEVSGVGRRGRVVGGAAARPGVVRRRGRAPAGHRLRDSRRRSEHVVRLARAGGRRTAVERTPARWVPSSLRHHVDERGSPDAGRRARIARRLRQRRCRFRGRAAVPRSPPSCASSSCPTLIDVASRASNFPM